MNSWLKLTGNVEVNEKLENSVSILFLIKSINRNYAKLPLLYSQNYDFFPLKN